MTARQTTTGRFTRLTWTRRWGCATADLRRGATAVVGPDRDDAHLIVHSARLVLADGDVVPCGYAASHLDAMRLAEDEARVRGLMP